ncbi:MAG: SRPBCC domain-containing protein [Deltaproteobacteria bacterium]|nr:SRPBCC domain-containing protein [Deltaproteobacteria bacterium]MBI3387892.1 SRPBCC domain-containing protein [Deltaproteobacteria bacterium]
MTRVEESVLVVRRSIHITAPPERVWAEFTSFDRMNRWWGVLLGTPEAGTSKGQRLRVYEPRAGGRVEMEVMWDGEPVRYGGPIVVFQPGNELTFENDWIPNRGWLYPTRVTLRLTPALGGTLIELLHSGFERVGGDVGAEHAGYEAGWGMTQLNALRALSGKS